MNADWILNNVNLATMQDQTGVPYGEINDGLIAVHKGTIAWVGQREKAPDFGSVTVVDGEGGWMTPGLVDCHTHLIYAGNRAQDFEQRLLGQSYQQISAEGGGINSTVSATRNASEAVLESEACFRLGQLLQEGVTTVEIKSGYGLDLDTEMRMLKLVRALEKKFPVTIRSTYLGAHAIPIEYKNRADDYIDFICQQILPAVAEKNLADAVDVFCESIGFTIEQCKKVFSAAQKLNLPVKGHVEQLSYLGGAKMVAEFNGLSVDHVEYLPIEDIAVLKEHDIVAVLLPGAFYFLNEKQKPPVVAMREAKLSMAVATDLNPGSAPMASLLLAMNQSCVLMGLTSEEALAGVTRNAAQALGLGDRKGQIRANWDADLVLWDIKHPAELSYSINMNRPKKIWQGGRSV